MNFLYRRTKGDITAIVQQDSKQLTFGSHYFSKMDGGVDCAVFGPDAASQDDLSARWGILSPAMGRTDWQRPNGVSPDTDMTLSALSVSSCSDTSSSFSSMSPSSSPVSFSPSVNATQEKRKVRSRKKASYKHVPHCLKPPHLVAKRNARERKRVQAVNSAFSKLRKHVPYEPRHKRLSKVKTLRFAIEYIRRLQELIYFHDRQLQSGDSMGKNAGKDSNPRNHEIVARDRRQNCCQAGSTLIGSNARRRAKISDAPPGSFYEQTNETYDVHSSGKRATAQHKLVSAVDWNIRYLFVCPVAGEPPNQQTLCPNIVPPDVLLSDRCEASNDGIFDARSCNHPNSNVASVFQTEARANSNCSEARPYLMADDMFYDSYNTGNTFPCFPELFQDGAGLPTDMEYNKRFRFASREAANKGCSERSRQFRGDVSSSCSSCLLEPGLVLGEDCGVT